MLDLNTLENRIIELSNFWYSYVNKDHHKDRDCHFYIKEVYSYGEKPYWRIEHYGYIVDMPDEVRTVEHGTYTEAKYSLYKWMLSEVKDVINFYKDYNPKLYEDYNWPMVKELSNKNLHILDYEN